MASSYNFPSTNKEIKIMSNDFAGKGRKRPQLNIPVELLDLDTENPRLRKENESATQLDLLQTLYHEFDVEELAYSMVENGYFDEEPVVVVPQNPFANFKLGDSVEQQLQLQDLTNQKKIRFTVVEGNRRLATLKLLLNSDLRNQIKVNRNFPSTNDQDILEDLKVIPAIFYDNRNDISAYLGVRHIAGLLKWEAYAKAVYLADRIEGYVAEGNSFEEAIKIVQRQTADRSDVIKKQYLCYKVVETANDDLNFDVADIKKRFSLITVAINSPSIREFIGVKSYKTVDFSERIVPLKNLENLEKILTWIYGNGKEKQPILTDSRRITNRLSPILSDEAATEYLLKYENLEAAYERSGGEKKFLIKNINDATKNLTTALGIAFNYKTEDIKQLVEDCIKAAEELKKMVTND
jgi:hypothetical protein